MVKWFLAVAVVGAALLGWILFGGGDDGPGAAADAVGPSGAVPAQAQRPDEPAVEGLRSDGARRQDAAPPATDDPATASAELVSRDLFPIRLVDALGTALPGVEVRDPAGSLATDADGRGDLTVDPLETNWGLEDRLDLVDHIVLAAGRPLDDLDPSVVVVAAPEIQIEGRVVDADSGAGIAGASVRVDGRWQVLRDLPLVLDRLIITSGTAETTTDESGTFRLDGLPGASTLNLSALADGFESERMAMPTADSRDLRFELARPAAPRADPEVVAVTVRGRVFDSGGQPVQGARVGWSEMRTPIFLRSGADGSFEFTLKESPAESAFVFASSEDLGLVVDRGFGIRVAAVWPEPVDAVALRFPDEPPSIHGTLSDAEGEPLAGWMVKPLGGTPVSSQFLSSDSTLEGEVVDTTGRDGAFVLSGLDERPYELVAYSSSSGSVDRLPDVWPGSEPVDWVLPADAQLAELRGLVVTTAGKPLVGAVVSVNATTEFLASGGSVLTSNIGAGSATTDEEGRFVLNDIPRRHATLTVSAPPGQRVEPPQFDLGEIDPDEELLIEVPPLRALAIEVDGYEEGQFATVQVLDGWGEPLTIATYIAGGSFRTTRLSWSGRSSNDVWVSERAVEVVLSGTTGELDRVPVSFSGEGVTQIRLRAK